MDTAYGHASSRAKYTGKETSHNSRQFDRGKSRRVVIQDNSFVGKVASHNSRQFLRGESSKSHNTRQFARGESSNSHTFTPIRTCIPEIRIKAKRHGKNFKRHFKFESLENLSKNITFRIQNFNTETKTSGWLRLSKSAA
jgi:hypothetical protein